MDEIKKSARGSEESFDDKFNALLDRLENRLNAYELKMEELKQKMLEKSTGLRYDSYDNLRWVNKQYSKIDLIWNNIDENFDWGRVQKGMDAVGWRWVPISRVPTVSDLKENAERLVRDAYRNKTRNATGGLEAEYIEEDDTVRLIFVFSQWEGFIDA
jgi:hypothetical protein